MANLRGNRHVVVEISEAEGQSAGWTLGFYRAPVSPQEASKTGRQVY
jgi:hypothetical protein